ncbi:flagellar biosynthetic protein FliO [Marinobacter sp. F3R08]|uniref:flagellar biosynthetic protein FliO n=1 Tax=Marinobacter sp. F3R08 TaxID=2841559 RepID=UPI001C09A620|nr:flagellar biosynthetic protein FliO [Marinobacter sp. F3R08]MBU2955254.1 flagellar biosynthetic protein FliO [Marinobacter sp. F3R08]
MWSRLTAATVLLVINPVFAQETATTAAQDSPVRAPDTLGTLVSLGLGLVAVVAVIYGCAWIIRRMNGMTGMNNNAIKVVSVMAIGARERIALIQVGDQQILLGITPSAIRTLHVFDEPVVEAGSVGSSDFARRLQGMIGKPWTSPTRND